MKRNLTVVKIIRMGRNLSRVQLSDGSTVKLPGDKVFVGMGVEIKKKCDDGFSFTRDDEVDFWKLVCNIVRKDKSWKSFFKDRVDLRDIVNDLFIRYRDITCAFTECMKRKYKLVDNVSGHVGYMACWVKHDLFRMMKKVEIEESMFVGDANFDYLAGYRDNPMERLVETCFGIFDKSYYGSWTDSQKKKFNHIAVDRWLNKRACKIYDPVNEFEAAYLGMTKEQLDIEIDDLVEGFENDREMLDKGAWCMADKMKRGKLAK